MAGAWLNYKKAIEWFEKAAEQGFALTQYNLGAMYGRGQGVDVNYKEGVRVVREGAEKDTHMLRIIWVPCTIMAMAMNYKKAFGWYEKAAEQARTGSQVQVNVRSWPRRM